VGANYEILRIEFDESTKPKVVVAKGLSHEELVLVEANLSEFEGCEVQENARRRYPDGDLFAHLIGYTAKVSLDELRGEGNYAVIEQIGKSGVEKSYETVLRGTPGQIVIEKDSSGMEMQEVGELAPIAGEGLVLWADRGLQEKITQSMQGIFNELGAGKGTAVALDPQTGGVLALVSMPNFDTNVLAQGISEKGWNDLVSDPLSPMFNRAISGFGYPTGSVIKPIVGIAALEEEIIGENTSIFAPLELCVTNIYTEKDECFRDWTFHGSSDIRRAIAESVNTFFYIIGGGYEGRIGLGPYIIKEYLELFGWGQATGIDIPGEGNGILPELGAQWRLGDTYHFSIGQGPFAIPPIQVAKAFTAIANGGTLYTPQVAQKTINSAGEVIQIFEPKIEKENIVDAETLEIIRSGMRQTVRSGSASGWLNRIDVSSGAKTGTAQTGRKTRDGRDFLHSWTVAFAPYENPEIVLVVMIEDLKEGQVGTLPIARDVFQWYFSR
jgi:penicillin-binding protein 2